MLCGDSERTVEDRSVRPGQLIEGTRVRTRLINPVRWVGRIVRGNNGLRRGKLQSRTLAFLPSDVRRETRMYWTTPTLEEIRIGLEINGYLPAEF